MGEHILKCPPILSTGKIFYCFIMAPKAIHLIYVIIMLLSCYYVIMLYYVMLCYYYVIIILYYQSCDINCFYPSTVCQLLKTFILVFSAPSMPTDELFVGETSFTLVWYFQVMPSKCTGLIRKILKCMYLEKELTKVTVFYSNVFSLSPPKSFVLCLRTKVECFN